MAGQNCASTPGVAPKCHVLIIESDPAASKLIKTYLEREGYAAFTAETGAQMRSSIEGKRVDFVILGDVLPDEGSWSILHWLRARRALPIIMLTHKAEPVDRVIGLELGADDCLDKPVDLRELLARMRTIQRRLDKAQGQPSANAAEAIQFAGWSLNFANQQLKSDSGESTHLTQAEYRILVLLARNPHRPVSRDELLETMAGRDWEPFDRSIDVHISKLRRKLDRDPNAPSLIRTIRGAGYMFISGI